MGRRSINTTKSGKYMNPTDQARKEARKKELKKNKRQRQMVRAAVLKNKDPAQILEEMEKIDEMEYNVLQPSPLNEKVLRDKRKKLKDTFDRVMRLYHNDEPEHWAELKRKEVEYEKKRLKKQQYYESVKHAQTVQIDEIPLPSATPTPAANATVVPGDASGVTFSKNVPPPDTLTMPPFANTTTLGGIKKPGELIQSQAVPAGAATTKKSDVIGVPPSPPPDILAMSDLDTDAEDDEVTLKEYNPKKAKKTLPVPNSLQQRMLAISGQNLDDFMKEMESVHKRKQRERSDRRDHSDSEDERDRSRSRRISKDRRHSSSADSDSEDEKNHKHRRRSRSKSPARSHNPLHDATNTNMPATNLPPMSAPMHAMPAPNAFPPLPTLTAGGVPQVPGMGPAALLFRPPPLRPAGGMPRFGMRLPIGPPGSRPPNMGNMPPRMGIRMPPGPPPGLPPRMQHHHKNANKQDIAGKGVTTITAKPQIRNLSADVTRFVPSTLRVKREEVRKPNRTKTSFATETKVKQVAEANKAATKDDAYLQFMNEMQDLL